MTDDLPVPVDRLTHAASAVFALIFALVVASLISPTGHLSRGRRRRRRARHERVHDRPDRRQFRGIPPSRGRLPPDHRPAGSRFGLSPVAEKSDSSWVPRSSSTGSRSGSSSRSASSGFRTGENPATIAAGDPVVYYAAMIVVSLLIVGPAEELLLRGVVRVDCGAHSTPRRRSSSRPSYFGALHGNVEGTAVEQVTYMGVTVVLGAILGVLYERTENVLVRGSHTGCTTRSSSRGTSGACCDPR